MKFRILLLPFSFVYAGIARLRNVFFNAGLFRQKRFDIPVILVGNLSVGGTGKTPHVEYLLHLLQKDYRVATLSRGYGRKSTGFIIAGKGISADVIGDEPMQYFTKFEDVTVAVCENRAEGIEKLIESDRRPQLIIMDDGYQHRQVNPGYKILLTSYDLLFTRDYVLPAGDLREPRSAYHRADCIVVTKCDENIAETEKERISKEIRPLAHQPLFFSSLYYGDPAHFFSYQTLPLADLKSTHVLLFSGIADPSQLEKFLKNAVASLETIRFSDHHDYNSKDISLLKEKFKRMDQRTSIILTTEKDYQRLRNTPFIKELQALPCYFIPIKIQIDKQDEFNHIIRNYVNEYKGNS